MNKKTAKLAAACATFTEELRKTFAPLPRAMQAASLAAQRFVSLCRWGIMDTRVTASGSGGEPWEVAYLNEEGKCVGYWAHGHFDPHQEYTGQPAVFKDFKA